MNRLIRNMILMTLIFGLTGVVRAQQTDEAIVERRKKSDVSLRSADGSQSVAIGVLFSQLADISATGNGAESSYSVTDARFALAGQAAQRWSYLFQTDFARDSNQILDLRLTYKFNQWLRVNGGQFKVPFGAEFLMPAADVYFINRSTATRGLVYGRSMGLEVAGNSDKQRFFYRAGGFVKARPQENAKNSLGAVRAGTILPVWSDATLQLAGGSVYAIDERNAAGAGLTTYSGQRTSLSGDAQLSYQDFLLGAEYLFTRYNFDGGRVTDADGFHVSAGYTFLPSMAFLVRYDYFNPRQLGAEQEFVIPALAWEAPDKVPVFFQLEGQFNIRDSDDVRVFAALDVAF